MSAINKGRIRALYGGMDEKDFKKHLQDLAHGHHHPEEHDWVEPGHTAAKAGRVKATAKRKTVKRRSPKKRTA